MFNEFKNKIFSSTPKKFRELKTIYDRLRLPELEERLLQLERRLKMNDIKSENLPEILRVVPSGDNKIYLIFHLHNPEGIEINSISTYPFTPFNANLIISGQVFRGAEILSEHELRYDITNIVKSYYDTYGSRTLPLKATFNGMEVNKSHTFEPGTVNEIDFVFQRTEKEFIYSGVKNVEYSDSFSYSGPGFPYPPLYDFPPNVDNTQTLTPAIFAEIRHLRFFIQLYANSGPVHLNYTFSQKAQYNINQDTFLYKTQAIVSGSVSRLGSLGGLNIYSRLYDGSTGSISEYMPFNVPSTPAFTSWIIQTLGINADAPVRYLTIAGGGQVLINQGTGYFLTYATTVANYISVRAYELGSYFSNVGFDTVSNGAELLTTGGSFNDNNTIERSGVFPLTKMSSVPYDLENIGF